MRPSREPAYCPTCGSPMMPLPMMYARMHSFLCVFDGILEMRDKQVSVTLNLPGYFDLQTAQLKQHNMKVREGKAQIA